MKQRLLQAATAAAMLLFLAGSGRAAELVRRGMRLCAASVIPALFPMMVLTSLLIATGGADALGRRLAPWLGRLLHCSAPGTSAFLLGILGGYPMGARVIGQLLAAGQITRSEAAHLLLFCNNAGPAFIFTVAGRGCFGSLRRGAVLFAIHLAAALLVGHFSGRRGEASPSVPSSSGPVCSFSAALVDAVGGAGLSCLQLTAFLTFFQVLLQLAVDLTHTAAPLMLGLVELTAGIVRLGPRPADFVTAAVLLGWGGCCVHCQSAAVLAEHHLPLGPYLRSKLQQALLSGLMAAAAAPLLF